MRLRLFRLLLVRLRLLRLDLFTLFRWLLSSLETPLATGTDRTHLRVVDLRIHDILEASVIWIRIRVRLVDVFFR